MSVIKEFILFAVGIVITVSLAVISINIYSRAAELGRGISAREEAALGELKEYDLLRFDGSEVDGSRVISYIRRMYATRDIPIEVVNDGRRFYIDGNNMSELRNTSSVYYISPLEQYHVSVSFDENDAASKITIEKRR